MMNFNIKNYIFKLSDLFVSYHTCFKSHILAIPKKFYADVKKLFKKSEVIYEELF